MKARLNITIEQHLLDKVQERLVLEAKRLLLHSNLNVSQIAYRLGFQDSSYFVKYFKKHAHLSPSEFRKSLIQRDRSF